MDRRVERRSSGWALGLAAWVFAAGVALAGAGTGWRELAWPAHVDRIERAVADATAVDASGEAYPADFRAARALLDRARRPLAPGTVEGRWKVRSLQVNRMGTFAYPWFDARIDRGQGTWLFAKTSGSQRRSGILLPHGDGRSLVFLGGTTVNDAPPVAYSRVRDGGAPASSDSIGRPVRIGPRELLLVLDADAAAGRYELYHLKR